ncbi:oxidoreductase family protein [[Mycobacterium] burgundiense]|uniref:Phosphotransferase n=1 Tax=[Mycobacterium] burgundiense TaxID=3064286 RepID=A0ABM9LHN2_9MYCO|nr:oxidoreductase family protein [Mycolicibacterium sp. MU0053]CAJ1499120.1 phosphotransferase [Mycolicibacterium sp. MU0053]
MAFTDYTLAELTPESLTTTLRRRPDWASVTVTEVDATPVGTGQMANSYRLTLTYADDTDVAPATMIAKISSTDETSRQMAIATGAYQREVFYYQHLSGLCAARAPESYFAEIADDRCGFILLLEDMGPAEMVDQITGCSADQADLALTQAAALHGSSWAHPALREHEWLPGQQAWTQLGGSIPQITGMWLERFGNHLDPEHVSVVQQLGDHVPAWLATLGEHRCLWHGDFRLDNLLFAAQGGATPIAVVDWQSVAAAPGIIDVSYFIGNSMTEADRAEHERDLVTEYHRRLLSYGVEGYSADKCWLEYQAHALYGLVLTIPVSLGVQATDRGDKMFAAMASRAAEQIRANDSYSAIKAL